MDQFFGTYKFATELRKEVIKESGLPISFGLSQNKVVSKVATGKAKPNNQMMIGEGKEKSFLAPLSVRKIPMVGNKTFQKLLDLGVRDYYICNNVGMFSINSELPLMTVACGKR